MSTPNYTEADIRQLASAESFQRGLEYCQDGAVASLVQRGVTLEADVRGSDPDPYRVQVTFAGDRLAEATCTCPYDRGGWCKHIVAALLAARQNPGNVEQRQPLAEPLTGLDRDQLQALLLKLADYELGVVPVIEAQVPLLAPSSTPVDRPHAPQSLPLPPLVDPKALRRQVRSLLGISCGRRSWHSSANVGSAAAAVSETVDQARKLVEAGDGRGALVMLDVITDEFLVVWEGLDDSDGESMGFFEELGELWAEHGQTDRALAAPDATDLRVGR